ncbi:MAG: FAD-dependent oxidoreductase [Usitatibacter sp.]
MNRYDALVVGAGPAGATAALRLAGAGLSVLVVEKADFPRRKVCGEYVSATTWPLLHALGVGGALSDLAGPAVRRVGFFARDVRIDAPMPSPSEGDNWGRAVGRQHLDTLLLAGAVRAGAHVRQPASVRAVTTQSAAHRVLLETGGGRHEEIEARVLLDAHGSWERPLSGGHHALIDSDLLGFKARFSRARLVPGLMPLVLFPGGYGGLVRSDSDLVSFSCCIRRDTLRAIRPGHTGAGEAVAAHAMRHCAGVHEALADANREGAWLAAGPIRPGMRTLFRDRMFAVGNAAGEAHPLVAEGITMAIQSSWLLADALAVEGGLGDTQLAKAGRAYTRAWRSHFAGRIRTASAFATLTMSPVTGALAIGLLHRIPAALTLGAAWSGKAHRLGSAA